MTTTSDDKMDASGQCNEAVNALPTHCEYCTFPDIDAVPSPYLLSKGISLPIDSFPARLGNFLVRPHVKSTLERAVPKSCTFVPTAHWKSGQRLDWWLAIPNATVRTAEISEKIPHCPKCGEPRTAHPGSQWLSAELARIDVDIFKTLQWSSSERTNEDFAREMRGSPKYPKHQWTRVRLDRHLWFSVRLEQLLKRLGFKGLNRFIACTAKPTAQDLEWVENTVARISSRPKGTASGRLNNKLASKKWFGKFLRSAKSDSATPVTLAELQKNHGIRLPKTYAQFITSVGTRKTFCNVDGMEGYDVRVVGPKGLNAKSYRLGKIECYEDEPIDGFMFAVTKHGDCFCFDLKQNSPDYPVYRFNYERMTFEPYAQSFVEAVRRFAGEEG
jgi:hypothetical protein